MQSSKLGDWQNPFVDVFKRYSTFQTLDQALKGNVSVIHDPGIARKCIKLSGSTPSNSTVTIPTPGTEIKNCDLTGRYLYLELFVLPEKFFIVHVDIGIKDREPPVRFTITNMDKEYSVAGGNTLKIPYQVERPLWTIFCVDIEEHLEGRGLFGKQQKSMRGSHIIKGFTICANAVIRGIYTSPNIYDWDSLPKEMSFKLVKGGRWSDQYNFVYLPPSINPEEIRRKMRKEERAQMQQNESNMEEVSNSKNMGEKPLPKAGNPQELLQPPLPGNSVPLAADPLLQLHYALAFSPIYNPDILFRDNTIYYSSGSLVVAKSLVNGEQAFLQGHTDYICAMDGYNNWIVTVQKGKAVVRVWIDHKCIYSFQAPQEKVQQIRLNAKKHLVMVATDVYNRQVITLFDISEVESKKKSVLLARQVSDFNILTIKFSPVEPDKLISCGRQNIRFWRTKNQHLPGAPVILKHHARNTIFTVLDFEYAYDDPNPVVQREKIRNVYVGSQNGLLFQVNYHTHELEEVYKLHESAICSIMMSVGFCVTGGEDQVLRVWPLDFSEYILEAEHEGIITSLALSEDGMHVACGTSSGGLGVLDLTNHNYKTILRSHTDVVIQMVYHDYSGSIITLSADQTIRLWDPEKLEQTYEFLYPKQDPCTSISGNPLSMFFAAGFKSGMLRIFDIEKTCISEQLKQHHDSIEYLEYSPDGKFLVVLEKKLAMLYSPLHAYQAIKHLPMELPSKFVSCSFSPDSTHLAVIGDSGTHINIWQLKTLQMTGKLFTSKSIKKLKFSPEGCLWATFEDAGIRRYNINQMTIEADMQALHRGSVNDINFQMESYVLFTVGEDSLLKAWDYSFQREPHQVFIGHVGAINGVLYKNKKIWTIGSEGVFQWSLPAELPKYQPPFIKSVRANFIKNTIKEEKSSILDEPSRIQPAANNSQEILNVQNIPKEVPRQQAPVMFSQRLRKKDNDQLLVAGQGKFTPQKIDMVFLQKLLDYKKSKKKEPKARIVNILPSLNEKYKLPQKHFFRQELLQYQKEYQNKIDLIKQNQPNFKIKYLIGYESYGHDNLVWNYVFGWFAYTIDNLVIVETLNKERTQKIIPLPEKIGTLLLSKDMKRLVCSSAFNSVKKPKGTGDNSSQQDSQMSADSSSVGQTSEAAFSNLYVLSKDFEIEKKLSFHPKGIQSICFSDNGKYLISIGNFRECTVCVWQLASGKLKASSYTLDKLNDVKAMEWASEGRNLEFATVGRDQVHFWALDRDDKLEYYDVFIPKDDKGDVPELTACEYIYLGESPKLLCGLTTGEILAIQYGSFKTVLRRILAAGPIMCMQNFGKKIVVTSTDGSIYFWSYDSVLKDITLPNFNKINLQYSVNAIAFDPEGEEGLAGTSEGIYYTNLKEQYSSTLVGSFTSGVIFTKVVNQNYFLTSHHNGRTKLWNIQTGEQIRTYKWKSPCREAFFDDTINKLFCFVENNNQVKLVNLNKFTRDEIYTLDETVKPDYKADDYAIKTAYVSFGGRPSKWVFLRKGDAYTFELVQEGRKKIVKMQKVLELGYEVASIEVYPEKNMIFAISTTGIVSSYSADTVEMNKYSLTIMDKVSLSQVAGAEIKTSKNFSEIAMEPQPQASSVPSKIQLWPSRTVNETYFAICDKLQYVYFRNYMKRVTLHKIMLSGLPLSINAVEGKKQSDILVGLYDGSIEVISALEPESRYKVQSVVNGPVESITTVKGKQTVILTHNNAVAIYTI